MIVDIKWGKGGGGDGGYWEFKGGGGTYRDGGLNIYPGIHTTV